ncbi:hypothetical protein D3C75_333310 [compost metagenome]
MLKKVVKWFSTKMLEQLQANQHKIGWDDESNEYLLNELDRNVVKLMMATSLFDMKDNAVVRESSRKEILRRTANIANFAMMIADNANREANK